MMSQRVTRIRAAFFLSLAIIVMLASCSTESPSSSSPKASTPSDWLTLRLPQHSLVVSRPPDWKHAPIEPTPEDPAEGFQIETRSGNELDADFLIYVWFPNPGNKNARTA